MPPRTTTWPLDEQTRGKHDVLRCYLNAWLPILGMTQGRIIFIDGFAGPGQYTGGEDGSPIIAMQALINHNAKHKITAEVLFLFVEADGARAAHLQRLVEGLRPSLPESTKVVVRTGEFHAHMAELLDGLDAGGSNLAPSLVMIDPFGISGIPMTLIGRILRNPRAEIYITIMWEFIYRFKETPEFERHLDEMFGTDAWRRYVDLPEDSCRAGLFGLYEERLREAGAKYVIHFDLYKENRHVYTIFHASKHPTGCSRMKEAIWKAVPAGDYQFRGSRSGQLSLEMGPNFIVLQRELVDAFGPSDQVSIGDLEDWMSTDATNFIGSHLRTALRAMEGDGSIVVTRAPGKRRGTYPDGTQIQFVQR